MSRYVPGDILQSDILKDFVIIITNNNWQYVVYSKSYKSIKEYFINNESLWTKLNEI